jgi:class 3 adenylate cyclase/tetratricopeptide (TPR) repeat protein
MPTAPTGLTLEIACVLFLDIVGYSKLPMERQHALLADLQALVRETSEFQRAQKRRQLISLPTGDGMALVFFGDPAGGARCALELSRMLRTHPGIQLRMGVHVGPVYRVDDINANRNVAGGGINLAQRVMDCGDAGHILVSQELVNVLGQLSAWSSTLHELGEAEVKHGVRVHIYNLFTEDAGNPELPGKLQAARLAEGQKVMRARRRRFTLILAAGLGVAMAAAGAWFYQGRREHALTATDTILLAEFSNKTNDTAFDDILEEGLRANLQQSPYLKLLGPDEIRNTLKLMNKGPETKLTPDVALELCERAGSKHYISGAIAGLGSQYVLTVKAIHCDDGDIAAEEQAQAAGKEQVLNALDKAVDKLREKVGEPQASVKSFAVPLDQATTPSLEALKAFSTGNKTQSDVGDREAIPYYQRAIELDPNFAWAYGSLANSYANTGNMTAARENIEKAYALRGRVSERENLSISADYNTYVTGDMEKANEAYLLMAQTYPRDDAPHNNLAGNYVFLGQYEKSLAELREAIRLNPNNSLETAGLIGVYTSLDRLDDARGAYQQAMAQKLEYPILHANFYMVAFLAGDQAEMQRQVKWAAGKPGVEDALLFCESDTQAYLGRAVRARDFLRRAVQSAVLNGSSEQAASYSLDASFWEAEMGNLAEARQQIDGAHAISSSRDTQILTALALARLGDSNRAEKLANDLAKSAPQDTLLNGYWIPTVRASIAINRSKPDNAIEVLQAAMPFELGAPESGPESGGYLYPVYVRGQAYLQMHQGAEAAAEFQKFQDYRGVVRNSPLGALARLGLARGYALEHDKSKARAAYQDFLILWKDADADLPILRQAKSEFAQLGS